MQQMELNAYEIFNQKVKNRQTYLQNDMIHRWSGMDETVNLINGKWETMLEQYSSSDMLLADRAASDEFLMQIADSIIYTLRKNSVTGAFVVLDQSITEKGSVISRPGLYVRDTDPESSAKDNSDLSIKRGSAALYRTLGITTDISWTPRFSFDTTRPNENAYFNIPLAAAKQSPRLSTSDLGYWCPPTDTTGKSSSIITYSVPLVDSTGNVYGIVGIDISIDYINKMLPSTELNENKRASYCLARTTPGSNEFSLITTNGSTFSRYFSPGEVITLDYNEKDKRYHLDCKSDTAPIYIDVEPLQLYNTATPFADDQWVLLGVISTRDLLHFQNTVNNLALISSMAAILMGIVLVCVATTLLTKPIRSLIAMLRNSDPQRPVTLSKVYVTEIDELSSAIEDLSIRVSEASSTLSRIIEMSGMSVAAFEFNKLTRQVALSGNFFPILHINMIDFEQEESYDIDVFRSIMEGANLIVDEELEKGWIVHNYTENNIPFWVKITLTDESNRLLGVMVDITEDTLSKRKIEYERDYDLLTNLLNRRAFMVAMNKLFENPVALKISALIMVDLDNLKYINDSYGHDCGDGYLRAAANAMKSLPLKNKLVARMSGDEFFIFIHGYNTKEEIHQYINKLKQFISESYFSLPGGDSIRIRCSAGITWYPENTTQLDELIRYADFAMYTAKNSKKGDFCEFTVSSYNKNAYLLHSREELNKLIDHQLLDYHFQPIVNARTGEVFAYEALMRSRLSTLSTPMEVLELARSQSKLDEIERITLFASMEATVNDSEFLDTNCRIFVNSISNHILSDEDIVKFCDRYRKHLHRMVLEITEEDKFDEEITRKKKMLLHEWGGEVALDDFGTGYNSEMVLLQLIPNYVKIDMSIVRNIDTDPSRQELLRNLVSYSHERNIMVIAEGVETIQEMNALISMGADYLQGYYLGMPTPSMQRMSAQRISEIHAASGYTAATGENPTM